MLSDPLRRCSAVPEAIPEHNRPIVMVTFRLHLHQPHPSDFRFKLPVASHISCRTSIPAGSQRLSTNRSTSLSESDLESVLACGICKHQVLKSRITVLLLPYIGDML